MGHKKLKNNLYCAKRVTMNWSGNHCTFVSQDLWTMKLAGHFYFIFLWEWTQIELRSKHISQKHSIGMVAKTSIQLLHIFLANFYRKSLAVAPNFTTVFSPQTIWVFYKSESSSFWPPFYLFFPLFFMQISDMSNLMSKAREYKVSILLGQHTWRTWNVLGL